MTNCKVLWKKPYYSLLKDSKLKHLSGFKAPTVSRNLFMTAGWCLPLCCIVLMTWFCLICSFRFRAYVCIHSVPFLGIQWHVFILLDCCEKTPCPRQLFQRKALNWGFTYSFRGLLLDHHGWRQIGMELKEYLGALHPDPQVADSEWQILTDWCGLLKPQSPSSEIHLLKQATPPNSSQKVPLSLGLNIQTNEPIKVIFIHTKLVCLYMHDLCIQA